MIEVILDHINRALERLPEQYKGKPRLANLIAIFALKIQEIEAAAHTIRTLNLDNSSGATLDLEGDILGQDRILGQGDGEYLEFIKFRITLNNNQSTADEIILAVKFFTGATDVTFTELFPAGIAFYTVIDLDAVGIVEQVRNQIGRLTAAGVSLDEFGQFDETNPFLFNTSEGFGDNDDANAGGLLATVY